MSAYETRDSIRDSRAALLAEHKETLRQLAETQKDRDLAYGLVNELRKGQCDRRWWQWLRDLLPRKGAT
jgi:hypothetical protein